MIPAASLGAPRFTLAGPASGITGLPSGFTLTPDLTLTDTLTLSDTSGGGTFKQSGSTVTTLTFTASAAAQTFTYTPGSTGTKTIALSGSHTVIGSPFAFTSNPVPTDYTLTGPTTSVARAASANYTVTPAGTVTSDTVTLSDGGHGGSFLPSSTLNFVSTSAAQTFTYTGTSAASLTISATSSAGAHRHQLAQGIDRHRRRLHPDGPGDRPRRPGW